MEILRDGVDLQALSGRTLAVGGDAHLFEEAATPGKIRLCLDSSKETEKLKGMKLLLAMQSKGRSIPEFFPDVVKNVVVKNIEVKKMVYMYLVHYADYDATCREIALLSINSFQKDMAGSNQLIRGLALRVMTSIRVPDIIQIQLLAARKCAGDSSPYVRKCVANALSKIFSLDPEQLDNLKQLLEKLLKDSSTMVLGSAVAAFNEICPTSYDILHRSYRKLCHLLADMDEWTQVAVLDVMTRYIRNQFVDPAPGSAVVAKIQAKNRSSAAIQGRIRKRRSVKRAFYSDEEDESEEEIVVDDPRPEIGSVFTGNEMELDGELDPDHRLILKSSLPLLKSRNSGVVLGVCTLHYYCGTQGSQTMQQVGKALVRILRNRREVQYVVLHSINSMAKERPQMFRPFLSDFFIKSTDPVFVRMLKLEILTSLCTKENAIPILKELQIYIKDNNVNFVCTVVRSIGKVADADPSMAASCLEGIMHLLLCTKVSAITSECVVVLRQLLQQNMSSHTSTTILKQLIKLLIMEHGIQEPIARSSIVWLVGEFNEALTKVAPDILRILAIGYVEESTETKMQILNLAIKLALQYPDDDKVQSLTTYVLEMSRYDLNTDLRDRARFMTAMMGLAPAGEGENGEESTVDEDALAELAEHAKAIMLAQKPPPVTLTGSMEVEGLPNFAVGSLSSLVGHYLPGYQVIPPWPATQPDPSTRDAAHYSGVESGSSSFRNPAATQRKDWNDYDTDSSNEGNAKPIFEKKRTQSSSSSSSSSSGSSSESESGSDEDESKSSESNDSDSSSSSSKPSSSRSSSTEESEEEEERLPISRPAAAPVAAKQQQQLIRKVQPTGARKKTGDVFGAEDLSLLSSMGATSTSHANSSKKEAAMLSNASSNSNLVDFLNDDDSKKSDSILDLTITTSAMSISAMENDLMSLQGSANNATGKAAASSDLLSVFMGNAPPLSLQQPAGQTPAFNSYSPLSSPHPNINIPTVIHNQSSTHVALQEVLSEPRVILRPELGGGLSVSVVYRGNVLPTAFPNASCIYLVVKNTRDYNMRRVKVNFPTDVKRTNIPDIPVLAPGQELTVPMEMVLISLPVKQLKIDIRSDQGVYAGTFSINDWDLMQPLPMSPADFAVARTTMKGFGELRKAYQLEQLNLTPSSDSLEEVIKERVRRALTMHLVQDAGCGELLLAGVIRKASSSDRALLTIATKDNDVIVQLNCEDAVLCASLHDELKKILSRKA